MLAAALAAAGRIRRHYGVRGRLSDDELDRILAGHSVTVLEFPFTNIREMTFGRHILLRPDLPHDLRRWLMGHAFYHVLNGLASHPYLDECNPVLKSKDEHAAEAFAGYLLLGRCWRRYKSWEIAEVYDVPQDRIERWLRLIA